MLNVRFVWSAPVRLSQLKGPPPILAGLPIEGTDRRLEPHPELLVRPYHPLDEEPTLFRIFADCEIDDPHTIVTFASTYGMLFNYISTPVTSGEVTELLTDWNTKVAW